MQVQIQNIKYQQPQIWVCHVPRRTNEKYQAILAYFEIWCLNVVWKSDQCDQILHETIYLRLQYPVDLCMIIMLFLLCPYSSYRPWNPAIPGAPCRWSSRWCGCGTSLGVQWGSSQACMWQSLTMLLIITILLSIPFSYLLCQHIPIWSSPPPWTPFWFFPSLL